MISAPRDPGISTLRIAFFLDDRLPHDRKLEFHKLVTGLRSRHALEILPSRLTEDEFLDLLKTRDYALILLPWYRYLGWKKLERHFGTLRLECPTTVAGYFADALLPFELPELPSFHHLLMLDFYRTSPEEIDLLLRALVFPDQKSGFRGLLPATTPIHHQTWFPEDAARTRCIDHLMSLPLLQSRRWADRSHQIRFFLTALWSLTYSGRGEAKDAGAELELAESQKRLLIRHVATHRDLTLKNTMRFFWPTGHLATPAANPAVHGLIKNSDFLRMAHFPESNQLEITAFFLDSNPTLRHPGEVRGFWIEPLKQKHLAPPAEQAFLKRFPVVGASQARLEERLEEVLDLLKAVHLQAESLSEEDRFILEHRCSNVRFLIDAIEKKVAAKKKIA